jgi:hypothetical protein
MRSFLVLLLCVACYGVSQPLQGSATSQSSHQAWIGPSVSTAQKIVFEPDVNKCVDIPNANMTNGNKLQIWDCNGGKNQMWYFDGLYIRSGINDQKCLDVPGGDYTNGNKLDIWDCNGLGNQQFKGGGTYQWESVASPGKCIDLFGGDTTNGKLLEIWDCDSPGPAPGPAPVAACTGNSSNLNPVACAAWQDFAKATECLCELLDPCSCKVFAIQTYAYVNCSNGDITWMWVHCKHITFVNRVETCTKVQNVYMLFDTVKWITLLASTSKADPFHPPLGSSRN